MADLEFKVHGRSESPARIRVAARNFQLVVDEPPQLGGTDEGANPVEFVLAALVGCLNVVAHIVAKELGFRIDSLEIESSGTLNPERLFNQPTDDRAGYKRIGVKLRVKADADEATLERWLSIVGSRCPVSDNLGNGTPLELRYVAERSAAGVGA
jgi:uncharacterized OsmC-like protein